MQNNATKYKAPYGVPKSLVPVATTPPAKVVALKFHILPGNPNDTDDMGFDFIEFTFVSYDDETALRSPPSEYFIEVFNLETEITKAYVQYVGEPPYIYWQRARENFLDSYNSDTPEDERHFKEVDEGVVNGRLCVTPYNEVGQGVSSKFIMPMKNLEFITTTSITTNPTNLILAKFWHLFSKTPDRVKNRPKQMHIYIDVPVEDVILDIEKLNEDEYQYSTIGSSRVTNSEMFRWVIEDDSMKKVTSDNIDDMSLEEIEFIRRIIDSFNDVYRQSINKQDLGQGDPHVFKVAVENPRDHKDSIIIYLMKGQRWEI